MFIWARSYTSSRQSYLAGEDILDPQYFEYPPDISDEDRRTYFEPINVTDDRGRLSKWLEPYAKSGLYALSSKEGAARKTVKV
jgi:hypothetical protein